MQERYLGDVHDYVKWALFIHLHNELGERIGVNWHKTHPEHVDRPGNRDGNNRRYRHNPDWKSWEPALFEKLRPFQNPAYRSFGNFERDEVLPKSTLFFPDEIRAENDRDEWHRRAVAQLTNAGVIFLDPDNGFEVPSVTRARRPKYAMHEEARCYYRRGKVVVGIQFASRQDPEKFGSEVRKSLLCGCDAKRISILRARVAPNILFILLCDELRANRLERSLNSFAKGSHCLPHIKGENRIALIK